MRRRLVPFVGLIVATSLIIDIKHLAQLFRSRDLFKMDFIQFFLMGNALRSGANVYSPLPELAMRFDPRLKDWLPHPSAYPPIDGVIGIPFSYMPYNWAALIWLLSEATCLFIAVALLIRHFGGRQISKPVLITILLFLAWQPVYVDLFRGQVMMLVLLILTLTWLSIRSGRDVMAGLLLGLSLAVKLYCWPILLFLILVRRLKSVISAITVFVAANLLMTFWLGAGAIINYYFKVAPAVGSFWRGDLFNFSAWALGYRSFGPAGALVLAVVVTTFSIGAALRARDLDSSFMIMITASTILSPISWIQYFVTLLPVFCLIAARKRLEFREMIFGWLVLLILLPGYVIVTGPGLAFFGTLPFIGALGLIWLVDPIIPWSRKENTVQAIA